MGATPHESKASTASQRGVLPHRATNAARNGLSGTHTWPCAGKRTPTVPPAAEPLDLLSFLARNLGSTHVLLVGTYRSDEMRRTHALRPVLAKLTRLPVVVRIELQPMDEGEVVQLFTAIRVYLPQPGKAEAIVARSEGNPFYVEELLAAGDPAQLGMSSSLRDIWLAGWTTCPSRPRKCSG